MYRPKRKNIVESLSILPSVSPLPAKSPKRVLLVDDHSVFRNGIRMLIESGMDANVCAEASDMASALSALRRASPEMAVVDIGLPGPDGLELIKSILAEQPQLPILVVSMHDEVVYALRALRAGAKGYLGKQECIEYMQEALNTVLQGGLYLSPEFANVIVQRAIFGRSADAGTAVEKLSDRELEILRHIGAKRTTREIAEKLRLSIKTVESHRAHLKEKLGFSELEDLLRFAADWSAP